jgi:hypothetical protein
MIRINLRTILKHDTSAIFILRVIFICITLWSPIAKPSARRMIRSITKWSITQSVSEKQENYPVTKKTRSIIRSTDYALRKHLSYPTVKIYATGLITYHQPSGLGTCSCNRIKFICQCNSQGLLNMCPCICIYGATNHTCW